MWVDDKITYEFVNGDITAQAYRTYLRSQMEKRPALPTPIDEVGFGEPISFQQKAQTILEHIKNGNFYADNWEKRFLQDNLENNNPTEAQIARMDKMWRNLNNPIR